MGSRAGSETERNSEVLRAAGRGREEVGRV